MQENVDEGTRDALTSLESEEGSTDVDASGQGEVGGKGKGEVQTICVLFSWNLHLTELC